MFGYMVDPVVCKPSPGLVTLQQLVALSYRVGIYWGPKKFGALVIHPLTYGAYLTVKTCLLHDPCDEVDHHNT